MSNHTPSSAAGQPLGARHETVLFRKGIGVEGPGGGQADLNLQASGATPVLRPALPHRARCSAGMDRRRPGSLGPEPTNVLSELADNLADSRRARRPSSAAGARRLRRAGMCPASSPDGARRLRRANRDVGEFHAGWPGNHNTGRARGRSRDRNASRNVAEAVPSPFLWNGRLRDRVEGVRGGAPCPVPRRRVEQHGGIGGNVRPGARTPEPERQKRRRAPGVGGGAQPTTAATSSWSRASPWSWPKRRGGATWVEAAAVGDHEQAGPGAELGAVLAADGGSQLLRAERTTGAGGASGGCQSSSRLPAWKRRGCWTGSADAGALPPGWRGRPGPGRRSPSAARCWSASGCLRSSRP